MQRSEAVIGTRTKAVLGGTTTQYYCNGMGEMTKYGTTGLLWDGAGNLTKTGNHKRTAP